MRGVQHAVVQALVEPYAALGQRVQNGTGYRRGGGRGHGHNAKLIGQG